MTTRPVCLDRVLAKARQFKRDHAEPDSLSPEHLLLCEFAEALVFLAEMVEAKEVVDSEQLLLNLQPAGSEDIRPRLDAQMAQTLG